MKETTELTIAIMVVRTGVDDVCVPHEVDQCRGCEGGGGVLAVECEETAVFFNGVFDAGGGWWLVLVMMMAIRATKVVRMITLQSGLKTIQFNFH